MTTTTSTERLRVTFEVDKADFEEVRRIMTVLTQLEDPDVSLPLSDSDVAYTLYENGMESYFESYGDEGEEHQ
jgi:hypothetical protein